MLPKRHIEETTELQQEHAAASEDDFGDFDLPSDAQATLALLRDQLYPDPVAAAATAAAAGQTRHAKRSKSAPGPSNAAAAAVHAAAARQAAAAGLPPMILKHQLYTVLTDRTAADRDVEELRRQGKLRLFKLAIGADEHVLLLAEDYVKIINRLITQHQLEQQQQQGPSSCSASTSNAAAVHTLQAFRDKVLPNCLESCISTAQLLHLLQGSVPVAAGALASANIQRHLLPSELLCRDGQATDNYVFTVPGAAKFVSSVVAGRKELLQLLARKKYSEALQKELLCVRLRGSCLSMSFHLRDLEGRGLITCQVRPAGRVVRLVKRGR